MSNAYDKLERRLKGEEATGPPSPQVRTPGQDRPQASARQNNGYIAPRTGYVPAQQPRPQSPQHDERPLYLEHPMHSPPHSPVSHPASDDRNHPLHLHYRKRIRGIRYRWLGSGLLLGAVLGILLTLFVSALVVTQFPSVLQSFTGQPDLAVDIGENYLNREAASRIQNGAPITVGPLQVTGLTIDLKPDDRMDLRTHFSANVLITTLNFDAAVENQLSVKDGALVISMIGDPQLGNLNVPLDMLPFNLKDNTRQAIDKIDNDLIAAEINKTMQNAAGSDFTVQGVSTTDSSLTMQLQQK